MRCPCHHDGPRPLNRTPALVTNTPEVPRLDAELPEMLVNLIERFESHVQRRCSRLPYLHVKRIRSVSAVRRSIAAAYLSLPPTVNDVECLSAFDAFRSDICTQFDFLTATLRIEVVVKSMDPYPSADQLAADIRENQRIAVLATATTGGHPYLTNDENDMFRAIHDVFGHVATGCGFDRHGEEAAWAAHREMFTPAARPALTIETRGQSATNIESNEPGFTMQKLALLPTIFSHYRTICWCGDDSSDPEAQDVIVR
jgi:hypothetical protein